MHLSRDDPLFDIQKFLWLTIGLQPAAKPAELQALDLESCLAAARAVCLQTAELHHLTCAEDIQHPLNPRNEAAALALLLANNNSVCGTSAQRAQQLQALLATYPVAVGAGGSSSSSSTFSGATSVQQQQRQQQPLSFPAESPDAVLYRWALEQGATTQLTPALFGGSSSDNPSHGSSSNSDSANTTSSSSSDAASLRGCAASVDLPAGSVVMAVPAKLLITYLTAAESDFGRALSRLPGLDPETLAVIWTMVDRHDPESHHAPFWAALPSAFVTGLSAPQALVDLLKGVPLHQECMAARTHVRQQFEDLQQTFKVLLTAYAAYLQPAWFTLDAYLWAVELWYAYAIQVKFPDSAIRPALVPLASLINHAALPHVVHFSTVDSTSRCLELKSFRPVAQHDQVFLSYGPLPNSQLLLFYGFALRGNPYEQQELRVQPEQVQQLLQQHLESQGQQEGGETGQQQLLATKVELMQGRLQQPFMLTVQQPLPAGLLPCLRLLCASAAELSVLQHALQESTQQGDTHGHTSTTPVAGNTGSDGKKGKGKKAGGSSHSKPGTKQNGSHSGAADATLQLETLQQRWAFEVRQAAVLGSPISNSNEAAALAVLDQLLAAARQPYATCLSRLHKRQQLQAMLQTQQKPVNPVEVGFAAVLEVYLQGVLGLFDACSRSVRA